MTRQIGNRSNLLLWWAPLSIVSVHLPPETHPFSPFVARCYWNNRNLIASNYHLFPRPSFYSDNMVEIIKDIIHRSIWGSVNAPEEYLIFFIFPSIQIASKSWSSCSWRCLKLKPSVTYIAQPPLRRTSRSFQITLYPWKWISSSEMVLFCHVSVTAIIKGRLWVKMSLISSIFWSRLRQLN